MIDQLCEVTNYNGSSKKELVNVKVRLRKHIEFWKKLGTSNFILGVK